MLKLEQDDVEMYQKQQISMEMARANNFSSEVGMTTNNAKIHNTRPLERHIYSTLELEMSCYKLIGNAIQIASDTIGKQKSCSRPLKMILSVRNTIIS
jgi:hypothetical protein